MNDGRAASTKLEIPLSALPERTKDYLLAAGAAAGKTVGEVVAETLDGAAEAAGFRADEPQAED